MRNANERLKDIAMAGAFLAVGVGGFLFINPRGAEVYEGPGGMTWRSMPFIYSGIVLLLAGIWFAGDVFEYIRGARDRAETRSPPAGSMVAPWDARTTVRRLITAVSIALYALAFKAFGFPLATVVLLGVMQYVFGRTDHVRNWIVAICGAILLWFLFGGFLRLLQPGELWDPITPVLSGLMAILGIRL